MSPSDSTAFFRALSYLGVMFSDDLSETRQGLYWESFRDRCSLDEWFYACKQAMDNETFHKVPLPARLWEYIKRYRLLKEMEQHYAEREMQAAERYSPTAPPPPSLEEIEAAFDTIFTPLLTRHGELWHLYLPPELFLPPFRSLTAQRLRDLYHQKAITYAEDQDESPDTDTD